jgi:hypothetical protein
MGRRSRRRERGSAEPALEAPVVDHASPGGEQVLTLRTVLTPKTRAAYARTLHGNVLSQEDAWQRAVEFLFERLAVRWTVHGVATEGQRDLLARLRAATPDERRFVRETLRAHCAEWFPDVEAP